MNSVDGFKDDEYDDEEGGVDETVQKDHKALNRLKRDVGEFKEKTQNNIIDLRSTLIINDILKSENVIVAEASKPAGRAYIPLEGIDIALFEAFDKIKKLNGNLFHFGKCTKVAHNSEEKVIYLIRDSTIYVSIYLRVQFAIFGESEDVMFYLTKNHEEGLKSAILVATVTPVLNEVQLVRLHGKLSIKASEDLVLFMFSTYKRELLKREQKSVGDFKNVSYAAELYYTMTEEQGQKQVGV